MDERLNVALELTQIYFCGLKELFYHEESSVLRCFVTRAGF